MCFEKQHRRCLAEMTLFHRKSLTRYQRSLGNMRGKPHQRFGCPNPDYTPTCGLIRRATATDRNIRDRQSSESGPGHGSPVHQAVIRPFTGEATIQLGEGCRGHGPPLPKSVLVWDLDGLPKTKTR